MLNLKSLRLVKEQKREPFIGNRAENRSHNFVESFRGRVGFTQKLVSAPTLLNSRKDRRKDGVFFCEM